MYFMCMDNVLYITILRMDGYFYSFMDEYIMNKKIKKSIDNYPEADTEKKIVTIGITHNTQAHGYQGKKETKHII